MRRIDLAAAFCVTFGLSLIVFRAWWVRERIGFHRNIVVIWDGTRAARKAETELRWYETHRAEAERRSLYVGLGVTLVGVVLFLL